MKTKPYISFFFLLFSFNYAQAFYANTDTVKFTFVNSQKQTISGQLILPNKAKSEFPVLIFLTGSAESSFKTNYKGFLKENFENQFLEEGVALCYFDKPGLGLSDGKWFKQNFYDRASDVKSCIEYLTSTTYIDPKNVGVVGHSQGGWVAQIAAAQYPGNIKYFVSLAGPTYSVKRQLISDFQSDLTCKGIGSVEANKSAVKKTNFVFWLSRFFPFNDNLKQLKKIRNFEPEDMIRKIKVPGLFLFGENDRLVYKDWCIESLNKIFKERIPNNIQYSVIEDANHSFEIAPFCGDVKRSELKYSLQFQQELKAYILNQSRKI